MAGSCENTITITRGADWSVSLAFKDENDAAIDYTGATLSAEILSNGDDSVVTTPNAVWTNEATGEALLSLDEAGTQLISKGAVSRLRITTVTSTGTTKIWPTALVEGK